MKPLKTSVMIGKEFGYLDMKYSSDDSRGHGVRFRFVDKSGSHIDGYWIFHISYYALNLINGVGNGSKKSDIDITNERQKCLKIVGIDEI